MEVDRKTQGSVPAMPSEVPAWLTRHSVYKRMPVHVRQRLDAALLSRSSDAALESIAARLKLSTYGISVPVLKKYVLQLERWIRPSLTAQVLAGVLGCLPESYRRRLVAGGEVLLLSRVMQALSAEGEHALPVGDLAKLASVLTAFGRSMAKATVKKGAAERGTKPDPETAEPALDDAGLARTVRELYGLVWPPKAKD